MAKIQVNEFRGIQPKISNDKLPENMGQITSDLKTNSLEIRGIRKSTPDVALPGATYKTLFEYFENGNNHWVYLDEVAFWARAPVADDTFERMYFMDESGTYKAFANDINSGPWDFTTDFYQPGADSGIAPTLAGYTGGGAVVRDYFYSYVSRYGEQGPGSAIAGITDYTSGRVYVNNITRPPAADDHLITAVGVNRPKIRVYRTDSAASTTDFFEVCEAEWFDTTHQYLVGDFVFTNLGGSGNWDLYECTTNHLGAWNGANFTQGELVSVDNLGLSTTTFLWARCPDGLTNLRSHPNGFFVASKDNVLYFSEPFAPWAWPEDYRIPIDANVIGIGIFGTTIVVATDANIYTFSGPHPESLYKQRLAFQPCLSQRAVVETDLGVLFPSAEGFQLVAADSAPANVTQDWFKPEDWDDFELETMHSVWYNKAYYGFYKSADFEGNIKIDFINNSITTGSDYHQAAHVTISDGIFRTIFTSNVADPGTQYISKWDADATRYRNYQWFSKRYILEKPMNFKVAQIIIDTAFYQEILALISESGDLATLNNTTWTTTDWGYQMGGPINDWMPNAQDINGDDLFSLSDLGVQDFVEFNVYCDGTLKFTKQVNSSTMFKLPRGFKAKKWEWEVKGMLPIKRVTLATSTEEIV